MAWTTSATPRGVVCSLAGQERGARKAPVDRLPHAPIVGRAAALLHSLAIAMLLQPEPVHFVLLISGATLLMLVWQRRDEGQFVTPGAAPVNEPAQTAGFHEVRAAFEAAPLAIQNEVPPRPAPIQRMQPPAQFDDVLAHLSHELRTPLNAVIGFADLMDAETFGPVGHPRYREYLSHIRRSGADLLQSAETTLAIAELLAGGRGAPVKSVLSLDEVVRTSCPPGAAVAMAQLEGIEIVSDRSSIVRALSKLTADAARGDSDIRISARASHDLVILVIEATGDGWQRDSKGSLRLAAARLLLQSVDAALTERVVDNGRHRIFEVALERAVQADIFSWRPCATAAALPA